MIRRSFYITSIVIVITVLVFVKLLPAYFYGAGERCYKARNYVGAYKNFAAAKSLAPYNKDYRYNYVLALAHLKPTLKVQKEMFAIS